MGNAILVRRSGIDVSEGTAVPNQVLDGSSFYAGENSDIQMGTMPNRGAVNQALNAGGVYTIPEGYHNGSGKVTAANLASQTPANATAQQILSGQTAYVNGNKITGTMPNRGASNISLPINGDVVIPEGYHNGQGRVTQSLVTQGAYTNAVNSTGNNPAYIRIPQGYYGTNTGAGYPEIVYPLDMARGSGFALQSEVDQWYNNYNGMVGERDQWIRNYQAMEVDRNNWMNVANSKISVSVVSGELTYNYGNPESLTINHNLGKKPQYGFCTLPTITFTSLQKVNNVCVQLDRGAWCSMSSSARSYYTLTADANTATLSVENGHLDDPRTVTFYLFG